jgi:uncharacterized protein HemY
MRLDEVTVNPDTTKLAALGQFLLGRNKDMAAKNTVSVETFVRLANQMGVNVTADSLLDLAQQPPLSNIITNIQGNQVIFKGADSETVGPDTMSVDQARATVDQMAKRATSKRI